MNSGQTISSPRIAALQRALAQGDPGALDAFWQELRQHGAPIIEPIPGDDDHT